MESESQRSASSSINAGVNKGMMWIRTNKGLFLTILFVASIALIPLYGILFPPLVDLTEHLLISKLLWEKVAGISHLDLEISRFLGYRLFPALMLVVISFCKLLGISLVYLPRIVATTFMSLHAVVVVTILYFGLKDKSWKSCSLCACFAVPAAAAMYSACWFFGFVNYTLSITLLIPAIFLTERFLDRGKLIDAFLLFLSVLLVFTAHPFGTFFWLFWCLSRTLAGIATQTFIVEWKRLVSLGVVFLPILLYHFWATAGTDLAPSSRSFLSQPPLISVKDWYQGRFWGLLDGVYLRADDVADSKVFARFVAAFILFATVFVLRSARTERIKNAMLSSVILMFLASWVNDKIVPTPGIHWLAYEYRFSSTTYAICLAVAGAVFARLLPVPTDKLRYKVPFVLLGICSVLASLTHLAEVRKAYTRFDVPARKYMAKILSYEQPVGITLPRSRYGLDGSFLKYYICLTEPDCNLPGTTFQSYGGALYPVRLRSTARVLSARELAGWHDRVPTGPLVGYWKFDEPKRNDACTDSSGNGSMGKAHGTAVIDGKINSARSFSGSGNYIDIPAINISKAITVAAWVYSDNFVQDGFVVTKNPVNTQWTLFFESDGFLTWRGAGTEKKIKCAAPSNNNWHHIVAKQEGTAASLYVDGAFCASGILSEIGNAPSTINIGGLERSRYYYFTGRIDEVRIYNRALSDTEILELFSAAK